jgi:hypothetical protein
MTSYIEVVNVGTRFQIGDMLKSVSNNEAARLIMQDDGNFVYYHRNSRDADFRYRWASDSFQSGATFAQFQTDGNLVVYKPDGTPVGHGSDTYTVPDPNPATTHLILDQWGYGYDDSPYYSRLLIVINDAEAWAKGDSFDIPIDNSRLFHIAAYGHNGQATISPEITAAAKSSGQLIYIAHYHSTSSPYSSVKSAIRISNALPRIGEVLEDPSEGIFIVKIVYHNAISVDQLIDKGHPHYFPSVVCTPIRRPNGFVRS